MVLERGNFGLVLFSINFLFFREVEFHVVGEGEVWVGSLLFFS